MTSRIILLTIFFMTSIGLKSSLGQESLKSTLEKATENLLSVMVKADRKALSDLASDKLTYGHSSGKIETKKEFVETIASGASVFVELKALDQKVDIENNTGIVRHTLIGKTNDPGKGPSDLKIGVLLVWTKDAKGTWKLLARQAYKRP